MYMVKPEFVIGLTDTYNIGENLITWEEIPEPCPEAALKVSPVC